MEEIYLAFLERHAYEDTLDAREIFYAGFYGGLLEDERCEELAEEIERYFVDPRLN